MSEKLAREGVKLAVPDDDQVGLMVARGGSDHARRLSRFHTDVKRRAAYTLQAGDRSPRGFHKETGELQIHAPLHRVFLAGDGMDQSHRGAGSCAQFRRGANQGSSFGPQPDGAENTFKTRFRRRFALLWMSRRPDRAMRIVKNLRGNRAEQRRAKPPVAPRGYHDEPGADLVRDLDDFRCDVPLADELRRFEACKFQVVQIVQRTDCFRPHLLPVALGCRRHVESVRGQVLDDMEQGNRRTEAARCAPC